MKRTLFLSLLALLLAPLVAVAADKPNIILLLADDLGARDLACFGSTYSETPNLDRLAARGVRLTQAYSASPLCSPTRSSILTGPYPARIGITAPVCHLPTLQLEKRPENGNPNTRMRVANSVTRLKPDYHTLDEALKDSGYATAHFLARPATIPRARAAETERKAISRLHVRQDHRRSCGRCARTDR